MFISTLSLYTYLWFNLTLYLIIERTKGAGRDNKLRAIVEYHERKRHNSIYASKKWYRQQNS